MAKAEPLRVIRQVGVVAETPSVGSAGVGVGGGEGGGFDKESDR